MHGYKTHITCAHRIAKDGYREVECEGTGGGWWWRVVIGEEKVVHSHNESL